MKESFFFSPLSFPHTRNRRNLLNGLETSVFPFFFFFFAQTYVEQVRIPTTLEAKKATKKEEGEIQSIVIGLIVIFLMNSTGSQSPIYIWPITSNSLPPLLHLSCPYSTNRTMTIAYSGPCLQDNTPVPRVLLFSLSMTYPPLAPVLLAPTLNITQ